MHHRVAAAQRLEIGVGREQVAAAGGHAHGQVRCRQRARPIERNHRPAEAGQRRQQAPADEAAGAGDEDGSAAHRGGASPPGRAPTCVSMTYMGRGLTSVKIRPRYSPRMPRQMSCTLPMNSIATMIVAQPSTV